LLALQQRGNIVLIDRNMQQLVNTFVTFGKPLPKAIVPKLVERTFETEKPQVTGLFMAPIVNQVLYGITVPVEIDGESRYVLGRSQDQQAIARLVAANELVPGRLAVVADAAHHIIAWSEQEDAFIGKEPPPAQWYRAGPGVVFEFTDPEGQSSLGIDDVGIDRLGNRRVGAQSPARGSGSGAVVDHRLNGANGICVGGYLGLMVGPAYRSLSRSRGTRCSHLGKGRSVAIGRHPGCRGRHPHGAA
jgi:hypothetical protein